MYIVVFSVLNKLEGKVAIITGGASGICGTILRLFLTHGAKVVVADIQDELGLALCQELDKKAVFVHCDVTNEDDLCNFVDLAVKKYGMYNNAGTMDDTTMDINKGDIQKILGVNLVGGLLGAKHAARVTVPACNGCILFTASATASIACTLNHSYVASKQGLIGVIRNISAELGRYGITSELHFSFLPWQPT